jgi:hypothetical protein
MRPNCTGSRTQNRDVLGSGKRDSVGKEKEGMARSPERVAPPSPDQNQGKAGPRVGDRRQGTIELTFRE